MNAIRRNDTVLRVEGLTKRYGDFTAVDQLSLEVWRGEILGFLGPNGAGKTTTLKMLCGLLTADSGIIEINGKRLSPGQTEAVHSIGVSPQEIVIWETLTCFEQLVFAGAMYGIKAKPARAKVKELLGALGLEEKSHKLAKTLSGGMQRRLNIALALVHEPEILFLDEPQAGLDPQSRVLVRDYIRSLRGRVTVIITTHDMEEAEKLADRICIVDRGRILAKGPIAAIKSQVGDGDQIEIELNSNMPESLLALLQNGDNEIELTPEGTGVRLVSDKATEILPGVIEQINNHGIGLEHLRIRKTTLEDVFIRLTGRELRE